MSDLPANSEKNERDPARRLARLVPPQNPAGIPPDDRRCTGISKRGGRCVGWAIAGETLCAGHAGISLEAARSARSEQAEARREARQSVRERAAAALDDDWPDVLKALQAGLKDGKPADRARVAVSYVQLVYGRQLQKPDDEKPAVDPLDVASLTREEREALKRKLLAEHPDMAARLRLVMDEQAS